VSLDVDEMQLTILGLEETGLVVLTGQVGEPPPEERIERLYRALLEANHNFAGTFGATLSIDPVSGVISLCRAIPLALADGDSFFSDVEHFVNVLETWKRLVEDFRAAADEPDETVLSPASGGMGGFLQV